MTNERYLFPSWLPQRVSSITFVGRTNLWRERNNYGSDVRIFIYRPTVWSQGPKFNINVMNIAITWLTYR